MIDTVKQKIKTLLSQGTVKGVVAMKYANGHVAPCLFQTGDDLDSLSLGDHQSAGDARYPLSKILVSLARHYPEEVFGILVRGCDQRGLNTLYRLNQLSEDKVVPIGIRCPELLAAACECKKPCPDDFCAGNKAAADQTKEDTSELKKPAEIAQQRVEKLKALDISQRFSFWMNQFSKCVKCYGCRDICPMCFCRECSLECEDLVSKGNLPVDIPVFHLTRAMHMADRCVDCGLCDEACPADIPLRLLYKNTSMIMNQEFGFTSGINNKEKSPLSIMGPVSKN